MPFIFRVDGSFHGLFVKTTWIVVFSLSVILHYLIQLTISLLAAYLLVDKYWSFSTANIAVSSAFRRLLLSRNF